MLAMLRHFWASVVEAAHFAADVWHEARLLEHQAEDRYGPLGF